MADAVTLSRLGQINGATGTWDKDNALFLKVFSGEVLTAFKRNCIFGDTTLKRSIQSGRSAQFPVTGRFTATSVTPGAFIDGQGSMAQNEVVIRIDDYLTAAADIFSLDEAKTHYDQRSIYSTELGEALARAYDKRIARLVAIGARTSTGDLTADLPSGLSPDDPYRTGTQIDIAKTDATSNDYVAAVFTAAQALDEKDVSSDNRVLICTPEIFYTLIQSDRAVNFDFNQQGANGSYKEGQIVKIAGFSIYSSNNIAQGNASADSGEQGFVFNGSKVTSAADMTNTGMLAFQRNAIGVVTLKDIQMSMSGNDYEVMYNSTKMKAQYACGFGVLRPECCVEVTNTGTP